MGDGGGRGAPRSLLSPPGRPHLRPPLPAPAPGHSWATTPSLAQPSGPGGAAREPGLGSCGPRGEAAAQRPKASRVALATVGSSIRRGCGLASITADRPQTPCWEGNDASRSGRTAAEQEEEEAEAPAPRRPWWRRRRREERPELQRATEAWRGRSASRVRLPGVGRGGPASCRGGGAAPCWGFLGGSASGDPKPPHTPVPLVSSAWRWDAATHTYTHTHSHSLLYFLEIRVVGASAVPPAPGVGETPAKCPLSACPHLPLDSMNFGNRVHQAALMGRCPPTTSGRRGN